MIRLSVLTVLAITMAGGGLSSSHGQTPAERWLTKYREAGGKADLSRSSDALTLTVERRVGQKPHVGLKGLDAPGGVRRVFLQGFEVDNDDLAGVAGWKDVEVVEVADGKKVSDEGVKAVARMAKLRELVLADTAVADGGIATLSGHAGLKRLTVLNTNLRTRIRVLELKDLPKLETLTLACAGVTEVRLADMPVLREVLDFPVELEVAVFTRLGAVTELDLHGTRLHSLLLVGNRELKSVNLRCTRLGDKAVVALKNQHPTIVFER
jgi:hypothetical protein